jgi:hypothetical protein
MGRILGTEPRIIGTTRATNRIETNELAITRS